MDSLEKQALQVAKEIVVKFIEVGRISPANFAEHFFRDLRRGAGHRFPVAVARPTGAAETEDKSEGRKGV